MRCKEGINIPLADHSNDITDPGQRGAGCGVRFADFPVAGKCYSKNRRAIGSHYQAECPHCALWASLPDGASLQVARILECGVYGYTKRITE